MNTQTAQILTKTQIEHLIDERLLSNVDGINSAIANSITLYIGIITLFAIFAGFNFFQQSRIKTQVLAEVNKDFDNVRKEIARQVQEQNTRYIRHTIESFASQLHEEEFYRNVLFKDLNEILAGEIHQNDEKNLKTVFNLHAERMFIVTQLTSGKKEETLKALKKLSTGTYKTITSQLSFKRYIELLEKKEHDTDLIIAIEQFKKLWEMPAG